jgi:hypothetical protein
MNDLVFLYACELVLATVAALALLHHRLAHTKLTQFLLSVGWHGPGDGS